MNYRKRCAICEVVFFNEKDYNRHRNKGCKPRFNERRLEENLSKIDRLTQNQLGGFGL